MAGNPADPTPVPLESLPPSAPNSAPQLPAAVQTSGLMSPSPSAPPSGVPNQPTDAAPVDPFGNPLPVPTREEIYYGALLNLVIEIDKMFASEKFVKILKTARDQGAFLTKDDPNIGKSLNAARKVLMG